MKHLLIALLFFLLAGCSVGINPLPGVNIHIPVSAPESGGDKHKDREHQDEKSRH